MRMKSKERSVPNHHPPSRRHGTVYPFKGAFLDHLDTEGNTGEVAVLSEIAPAFHRDRTQTPFPIDREG